MVKKKVSKKVCGKKGIDFGNRNFVVGLIIVVLVIGVLYFGLKEVVLFNPWDEGEIYEGSCIETGWYCEGSDCDSCEDICVEYEEMIDEDLEYEEYFEEGEMFDKDLEYEMYYEEETLETEASITGNPIISIHNFEQAVACCACGRDDKIVPIYSKKICYDFEDYTDCNEISYPICQKVMGIGRCRRCSEDSECREKSGETPACIPESEPRLFGACQQCFTDEHCKALNPEKPVCHSIAPMNRVTYFCVEGEEDIVEEVGDSEEKETIEDTIEEEDICFNNHLIENGPCDYCWDGDSWVKFSDPFGNCGEGYKCNGVPSLDGEWAGEIRAQGCN